MARTIVIGLDGASWNLLDPWMQSGDLPNLRRLVATSSHGNLTSTIPAVTYPAWKCYSTGRNPGKLGAYWWLHVDWERRRILANTSESFRSRELWDDLNDHGVTTGVLNMPTCYPPRPLDGFMVSGCITPAGKPFTTPRALERELNRSVGYRVRPDLHFGPDVTDVKAVAEDMMDVNARVLDAAWHLKDRVDFLHATVFYIDDMQHYLWDHDLVREAWRRIDAKLGRFADLEDVNLVLVSDHGFQRMTDAFHLNRWLEDKGYLVTKRAAYETLHKAGVNHDRVNRWGRALGLQRVVPERVKQWVWNTLPGASGKVTETAREHKVDWTRSKAFANGEGPVYVNPDLPDRDAFIARLAEDLTTDPVAARFVERVHRPHEIYSGPHVDRAPDLVVVPKPGIEVTGVLGTPGVSGMEAGGWIANHRPEGIIVLRIPGAEPVELRDARLYDVAPTLLALHGVPVPADMDGRVLDEALPKDVRERAREV